MVDAPPHRGHSHAGLPAYRCLRVRSPGGQSFCVVVVVVVRASPLPENTMSPICLAPLTRIVDAKALPPTKGDEANAAVVETVCGN